MIGMTVLFNNYGRRPVQLVKGKGTEVWDQHNKRYLDFTSGIAVLSLGHCHPMLIEALQKQSEQLWHVSNLFESAEQEALAKKLVANTHLSHALFCNSGAEANEAAIKLARKHSGRHHVITFEKSFHGRTYATMAATGQDKVKEGFGPLLGKFTTIPFNDCEALKAVADERIGAIMLEVIQGEGGVNAVTPEFANTIQEVCDEYQILLIIDEVQTGIVRTGTPYAFQQTTLKPDIISLAKGLGGGFPIGAVLATAAFYDTFGPGSHGTTFGGNPLAIAVATAVIDHVFKPTFMAQVQHQSIYFKQALQQQLPERYQVVGQGLLLGIDCGEPIAASYVKKAEENGLLLVQAGPNVIRLLPPLTVSQSEINEAVTILKGILT